MFDMLPRHADAAPASPRRRQRDAPCFAAADAPLMLTRYDALSASAMPRDARDFRHAIARARF